MAARRQVWTNDVQTFAAEVGRALFTSREEPPPPVNAADLHFPVFDQHRQRLENRFRAALDAEDEMLNSRDYETFLELRRQLICRLRDQVGKSRRKSRNLFTLTYSDSYFGVRQSIEADAIVEAVNSSSPQETATDRRRWLLIALGRALLKIANSTGHFAQYLKPNERSYRRFISQRRKSSWGYWIYSIGELLPVGTADWRLRNKAFNEDSLSLIAGMGNARERPGVIYADPPYTDDQYSRFYHILETLLLYDYPAASGAGLYRPDRFTTPFSLKSKAPSAFASLIQACARTGADMVLSYPASGLLRETGVDILSLLRKWYRRVECCYALPHDHSTFGASKGSVRARATELIYLAQSCQ
jgi:adenine-specific DNA-methyltransferase